MMGPTVRMSVQPTGSKKKNTAQAVFLSLHVFKIVPGPLGAGFLQMYISASTAWSRIIVQTGNLRVTLKQITGHEVQHTIQDADKFASSTGPDCWESARIDAVIETWVVKRRCKLAPGQRRQTMPDPGGENMVFADDFGTNQAFRRMGSYPFELKIYLKSYVFSIRLLARQRYF